MLFTVDRIESDFAVLIPDGNEKATYDVPFSAFDIIPHEGDVFHSEDNISKDYISLKNDVPIFIFDKELTSERRKKAKSRFKRLINRKK